MTSALRPRPLREALCRSGIRRSAGSPCASQIAASGRRAMHSARAGFNLRRLRRRACTRGSIARACPAGADHRPGRSRRFRARRRQPAAAASAGIGGDRRDWRHRSAPAAISACRGRARSRGRAPIRSSGRRSAFRSAAACRRCRAPTSHQHVDRHHQHGDRRRAECALASGPHDQRRRQHRQPSRPRCARRAGAKPPQRRAAGRRTALRRRRSDGPAARQPDGARDRRPRRAGSV